MFPISQIFLSRSMAWRVNESTPKLDIATRTERLRVSLSNLSCGSTFAFRHNGQTGLYTAQRNDVEFPSELHDFSTCLVTVVRGNTPIANRWRKRVSPCIAVSVMHPAPMYLCVTLDDGRDALGSKWEKTFFLCVQTMWIAISSALPHLWTIPTSDLLDIIWHVLLLGVNGKRFIGVGRQSGRLRR